MTKEIGRGGSSTVRIRQTKEKDTPPTVIKRPRQHLPPQEATLIFESYIKQKKVLDQIHSTHPTKSRLFNKIYEIDPKTKQMVMKNLGMHHLNNILNDDDLFNMIGLDFEHVYQQLKDAIVSMFNVNVCHRDIKPENIMVNQDKGKFYITLIDFADSLTRKEASKMSRFQIAGTPSIASPQLLKRISTRHFDTGINSVHDAWIEYMANDLWTLGMVLYYILYGTDLYNMFRKKHPSWLQKYRNRLTLYRGLEHDPEMFESLFPLENLSKMKARRVKDVKSLLSLDPSQRLQWLQRQIKSKKSQTQQIQSISPSKAKQTASKKVEKQGSQTSVSRPKKSVFGNLKYFFKKFKR